MEDGIKKIAYDNGADVCGIGSIERFDDFPKGFSPKDIWFQCKSVISLGIALPKGLLNVNSNLIYGYYNEMICTKLDEMLLKTAKEIEEQYDCHAVPMPSNIPYEYWDAENMTGKGLLSMKHVAVACGLGELGKSTLLLNKQFGNRLVVGAILTNLRLESDPVVSGLCLTTCSNCIDNCPVKAISDGHVNQKLCRQNTYSTNEKGFATTECNMCRALCPWAL